jgi:hypothetical protein
MSGGPSLAEGMERLIDWLAKQSDDERELWERVDFALELQLPPGRDAEATCLRKDGTEPVLRVLIGLLGFPTHVDTTTLRWRWKQPDGWRVA